MNSATGCLLQVQLILSAAVIGAVGPRLRACLPSGVRTPDKAADERGLSRSRAFRFAAPPDPNDENCSRKLEFY